MNHPAYNIPTMISNFGFSIATYKYVSGFIRWARCQRGSNFYNGWVICDSEGKPAQYNQANDIGWITVNASGSYMVA